jgi:hypothetical protein
MLRKLLVGGAGILVVICLVGCTTAPGFSQSDGGTILAVAKSNYKASMDALLSGTLTVNAAGCVSLDDQRMLAPLGSTISSEGKTISIAGLGKFRIGVKITSGGGSIPLSKTFLAAQVVKRCGSGEYSVIQP